MLEAPTALSMLRTNRIILRRALDTGSADAGFAARGVLYVARLEREVRDGLRDGRRPGGGRQIFRYSRSRRVCVRLTGISVCFSSFILRM